MRARITFFVGAVMLALFVGAPAFADAREPEQTTFPDLPGMKLADQATRGEVAPSHASFRRDTPEGSSSGLDTQKKASPPDASVITELPGTGQIPVISQMKAALSSARTKADTTPKGLAALAALGTIVSVGSFLLIRNRVLGT